MPAADIGHLDEATVAGFLDGELTAIEREKVAAHLEECDECRAELRELNALAESTPVAASQRGRTRGVGRLTLIGSALAASIAGIAVVRQVTNQSPSERLARVRAAPESGGRIEVVTPSSRDVPMSGVRFVWRSSNVDAYTFRLMNDSGRVLFTTSTADTTMAWPRVVPETLGAVYFWRVDGITDGVMASTGGQRLKIVP